MSAAADAAPPKGLNWAAWTGPLLTFAGGVSYFVFFSRFPALRDVPWVNVPLVLLGLLLSAWGLWRSLERPGRRLRKIASAISFVFTLTIALFFNFYVFVYSYSLPDPTPQAMERELAPDFALVDQEGRYVSMADLRGRKVVVTFYRGFW